MKLIKQTRKKTKAQPKTLRALSADECQLVSGGYGRVDYHSYSSNRGANFAAESSDEGIQ